MDDISSNVRGSGFSMVVAICNGFERLSPGQFVLLEVISGSLSSTAKRALSAWSASSSIVFDDRFAPVLRVL
jgi:hypothetical protein